MRLTIINQFYPPDISPTGHLAASLAEHRAALGDEVTVIASRGGYVRVSGTATDHGSGAVKILRVWTPRFGKSTHWKRLADYLCFYLITAWKMLFMRRQDVVVCLTTPPMIAWAGALHRLLHRQTRLVLWNMDCYPEAAERYGVIRAGGWLSRFLRFLNRRLFSQLNYLVALDGAMQKLLLDQYQPKRRKLRSAVIPNWEPADFFAPNVKPPEWEEAKTLGLNNRFVVLYNGNMGFGHRFETALAGAAALKDEGVVFLFVGGGKRFAEVREQVSQRQLDNVIMRDYVPTKELTRSVMQLAHCCLITLDDQALGIMSPSKLHAQLAHGLPVLYIGPKSSNVDEAIERFGCGVSLREGDVAGLVAFVRRLKSDPGYLNSKRAAARRAFEEAYNDRVAMPAFDRVFAELMGNRSVQTAKVCSMPESPPAPRANEQMFS